MAAPVRPVLTLAVSCVGMFLVLLDVTAVNVALPSIDADLHATAGELEGVVTAYTGVVALALLPAGRLVDRHRTASVYAAGLALFGLASVLCATSGTAPLLVLARAGQGVGAALLLPASMTLLTAAHVDPADRARALGLWSGASVAGIALGPLVGGVVVELAGWEWVFVLNVPLVLACLAGLLRCGAGHECGDADAALLPTSAERRPGFVAFNLASFVMNSGGNATLFAFTLTVQGLLGVPPLRAGLLTMAFALPAGVLAVVGGRYVATYGAGRVAVVGFCCALPVLVLLGVAGDRGVPLMVVAAGGVGAGVGLLTPALVHGAVEAVPDRPGAASAFNNVARQLGTTVGVLVAGTVLGSVTDPLRFVAGLHALAVVVPLWWLAGAVVLRLSGRWPDAA